MCVIGHEQALCKGQNRPKGDTRERLLLRGAMSALGRIAPFRSVGELTFRPNTTLVGNDRSQGTAHLEQDCVRGREISRPVFFKICDTDPYGSDAGQNVKPLQPTCLLRNASVFSLNAATFS